MKDFTDEEYIRLINNTIKINTKFTADTLTGGNTQITCNGGKTCRLLKYTVNLFFGYDTNRNSQKYTQEIEEDLLDIWHKAIYLKMKNKLVLKNGINYTELNDLMSNDYSDCSLNEQDTQLDVIVITDKNNVSSSVSKTDDESTKFVIKSQETTTTSLLSKKMEEYFRSKKLDSSNLENEFDKFLLYKDNNINIKDRELNWRRWCDKISPIKNEKNDYALNFKIIQKHSEDIEDWIFNKTGKIAPSYSEFHENPIIGICCVQMDHPHFDKKITIYYKQGGNVEKKFL